MCKKVPAHFDQHGTTEKQAHFFQMFAFFFCTYASTHPVTMWRYRGCHHMALAQESHLDPSARQSTDAPEQVLLWASRPHPEQASSPGGLCLQ